MNPSSDTQMRREAAQAPAAVARMFQAGAAAFAEPGSGLRTRPRQSLLTVARLYVIGRGVGLPAMKAALKRKPARAVSTPTGCRTCRR